MKIFWNICLIVCSIVFIFSFSTSLLAFSKAKNMEELAYVAIVTVVLSFLAIIFYFVKSCCKSTGQNTNYFLKTYKYQIDNFSKVNGRACRKEYNLFVITSIVAFLFLGFASILMLLEGSFDSGKLLMTVGGMGLLIDILFGIYIALPIITISVRRLHDINLSGWLLVLYLLIFAPYVNIIILFLFPALLCFLKGTATENKYGSVSENYIIEKKEGEI